MKPQKTILISFFMLVNLAASTVRGQAKIQGKWNIVSIKQVETTQDEKPVNIIQKVLVTDYIEFLDNGAINSQINGKSDPGVYRINGTTDFSISGQVASIKELTDQSFIFSIKWGNETRSYEETFVLKKIKNLKTIPADSSSKNIEMKAGTTNRN